MSAANDTVILCRFCGHINAAGAGAPAGGRCAGCGAFSGLEAVAEAEARQRSRRTRLGFLRSRVFRAAVVVLPLLAALFWLLWEYTGLPPDPPLPSTNIGSATAATPAGDWPQARGGVAGAAAAAGAGGGIGVDAAPAKVWEYVAGAPIVAPPAVVGDRIYLTAEDGRVVALARDTGAEPLALRCRPAGRCYAGGVGRAGLCGVQAGRSIRAGRRYRRCGLEPPAGGWRRCLRRGWPTGVCSWRKPTAAACWRWTPPPAKPSGITAWTTG